MLRMAKCKKCGRSFEFPAYVYEERGQFPTHGTSIPACPVCQNPLYEKLPRKSSVREPSTKMSNEAKEEFYNYRKKIRREK